MKPVKLSSAPLTADQLRIAQLFAAMDGRRQRELMTFATRIAELFPRRAKPALRLVDGGMK